MQRPTTPRTAPPLALDRSWEAGARGRAGIGWAGAPRDSPADVTHQPTGSTSAPPPAAYDYESKGYGKGYGKEVGHYRVSSRGLGGGWVGGCGWVGWGERPARLLRGGFRGES